MSSTVEQQNATLSQPAASGTSAVLVTAAGNRKGCIIVNDGTTSLYLAFGPTATVTAYTAVVAAGGTFTLDPTAGYGGQISGIWSGSPTGNARVTVW